MTSSRLPAGLGIVVGIVAAGALAFLLHRMLFLGQAQSFDAALYAQALWGFGHGQWTSSLLQRPSLAVHGTFLAVLLAPLTWVMPAALALALAQSAALGVTVGRAAHAFAGVHRDQPQRALGVGLWAAAMVSLGTPLLLNPFLFDLHPGLLGLPLATWGLLRAVERGGIDRVSLALLALSALAREEFALVAAAALIFAPSPDKAQPNTARPKHALDTRMRWVAALALVVYAGVYWFGVGGLMGSTRESIEIMLTGQDQRAAPTGQATDWGAYALAKLDLLVALALSVGGLSALGWRWAGAILPGLALMFANRYLLQDQLDFHYSMFMVPGLLAAALHGYRTWNARPNLQNTTRQATLAIWTIVAIGCFAVYATAPGGGRFRPWAFNMYDAKTKTFQPSLTPSLVNLHTLLDTIPDDPATVARVFAPFAYSAPLADRPFLRLDLQLRNRVVAAQGDPKATSSALLDMPTAIVLRRNMWDSFGHTLVSKHGFRYIDQAHGVALLGRGDWVKDRPIDWSRLPLPAKPASCASPRGAWPQVGLMLCDITYSDDGRLIVTLRRIGPTPPQLAPVSLFVIDRPDQPKHTLTPVTLVSGLVSPDRIPPGGGVTFALEDRTAVQFLRQHKLYPNAGLLLLDGQGKALPPATAADPNTPLSPPVLPLPQISNNPSVFPSRLDQLQRDMSPRTPPTTPAQP